MRQLDEVIAFQSCIDGFQFLSSLVRSSFQAALIVQVPVFVPSLDFAEIPFFSRVRKSCYGSYLFYNGTGLQIELKYF